MDGLHNLLDVMYRQLSHFAAELECHIHLSAGKQRFHKAHLGSIEFEQYMGLQGSPIVLQTLHPNPEPLTLSMPQALAIGLI